MLWLCYDRGPSKYTPSSCELPPIDRREAIFGGKPRTRTFTRKLGDLVGGLFCSEQPCFDLGVLVP